MSKKLKALSVIAIVVGAILIIVANTPDQSFTPRPQETGANYPSYGELPKPSPLPSLIPEQSKSSVPVKPTTSFSAPSPTTSTPHYDLPDVDAPNGNGINCYHVNGYYRNGKWVNDYTRCS